MTGTLVVSKVPRRKGNYLGLQRGVAIVFFARLTVTVAEFQALWDLFAQSAAEEIASSIREEGFIRLPRNHEGPTS